MDDDTSGKIQLSFISYGLYCKRKIIHFKEHLLVITAVIRAKVIVARFMIQTLSCKRVRVFNTAGTCNQMKTGKALISFHLIIVWHRK